MGGAARTIAALARREPTVATVVGSLALMALLVALGAPTALRLVVGLWVLATCAGLAWTPVLGLHRGPARAATVLGTSLAADTLIASALIYLGPGVSAPAGLLALAVVCSAGCIVQLVRPLPKEDRRAGAPVAEAETAMVGDLATAEELAVLEELARVEGQLRVERQLLAEELARLEELLRPRNS